MNVPRLRFKEYEGHWLPIQIGNIGEIITGSTPDTTESAYYNGSKLFVTPVDITSSRYVYETKTRLTEAGFKKGRLVKANSVLFVCIGSTIGKVAQNRFDCITNQQINAITPSSNFSPEFVYSRLENDAKKISLLAGEQAVPIINKTSFSKVTIYVPELPEQTKIANFLTAIDEKISQLTQKYDLLRQYKKGVMQQIFSQKLRFKDDDGREFPECETVRLGDIASFSKGKGISKADIATDGKTLCIRYGELYTEYGETIQKIKSKTNVNPEELQLSESNDVIIPASGETQIDIAKASCVLVRGVALGGDINIIKSNENGVFLSYYPNHQKRLDIAKLAQGNSVVHLYSSQLKLLDLIIPSKPEQTKIANFLTAIDDKITHTKTQLDAVKLYKKGLLQQMFV